MENIRCRRDGIGAEEKRDAGFVRCSNETHRESGVTADVAIRAGRKFCRGNFVADLKRFGGFAIAVAGLHGQTVGGDELRLAFEFVLEVAEGGVHRAVVEPVAHAEREEIFAAVHALGIEAEFLESRAGELGEFDSEQAIAVERMVFERAYADLRFAQVVLFEVVEVDDQDPVGAQIGQIHFERGGIHGDENVNCVAGRIDIARREVNLESADPGKRAGRGANLGREVGERGQIVSVQRGRIRELAAGDLHSVAGVTAETDAGFIDYFALSARYFRYGR